MGAETILYADASLDRIIEEQVSFDAAGHYFRPDLFRVVIDDRPHPPIEYTEHASDDGSGTGMITAG
jgi:nitrilase